MTIMFSSIIAAPFYFLIFLKYRRKRLYEKQHFLHNHLTCSRARYSIHMISQTSHAYTKTIIESVKLKYCSMRAFVISKMVFAVCASCKRKK